MTLLWCKNYRTENIHSEPTGRKILINKYKNPIQNYCIGVDNVYITIINIKIKFALMLFLYSNAKMQATYTNKKW